MANGLFNLKQVVQAVQQGGWPAQKTPAVEYLVVGGGGSGGGGSFYGSGGGGAGGLLTGIDPVPNEQTLIVTVGAGGATAPGNAATNPGFNSVFGSITALGGASTSGGGAGNGGDGGSGSGGGSGISFISQGGQGTFGQGNAGGTGMYGGGGYGGGGGAGSNGLNGYAGFGGNGGNGIASAISGTITTYAGGGGGGVTDGVNGGTLGLGGAGGGGLGGRQAGSSSNENGSPGVDGTGGGGGSSGGYNTNSGGAGGSGIVIVSYPDIYAAATTVNATASTSGSGSLNTSNGNYLYSSSSSNLALTTNSFTVEYWVNVTNTGTSNQVPVCLGSTANNPLFGYVTGGNLTLFLASSTGSWDIASNVLIGAISSNTWYHVAIVRNNTTFYTFLNGVQGSTFTSASSIYQNSNVAGIGVGEGGLYPFTGYISNVRILRGTALYTSNFTPPTVPLAAITNTQLLFNSVSGAPFADGSTNALTFTRTGSPAWNQLSPFTGTGYKNRVYTWTTSGTITF